MTAQQAIRIKPHHFVDILTAVGAGREAFDPHPYGHAVHLVARAILANPDVLLEIDLGADDICAPCDHNLHGRCDDTIDTSYRPQAPPSKLEWNLRIDRRWCERLAAAGPTPPEELRRPAWDVLDLLRRTAVLRRIPADERDRWASTMLELVEPLGNLYEAL